MALLWSLYISNIVWRSLNSEDLFGTFTIFECLVFIVNEILLLPLLFLSVSSSLFVRYYSFYISFVWFKFLFYCDNILWLCPEKFDSTSFFVLFIEFSIYLTSTLISSFCLIMFAIYSILFSCRFYCLIRSFIIDVFKIVFELVIDFLIPTNVLDDWDGFLTDYNLWLLLDSLWSISSFSFVSWFYTESLFWLNRSTKLWLFKFFKLIYDCKSCIYYWFKLKYVWEDDEILLTAIDS